MKSYLAEFIGTFALVFCGTTAIAVTSVVAPELSIIIVPLVFGLIIAVMIYAVGHISGAHFNPAVTWGFWIVKRFPTKKISGYWFFQIAGAICASLLVKFLLMSPEQMGVTVPTVSIFRAFCLEVIFTFFLMFVIISVATDKRASASMAGAAIGATVALDALIGGPLTGASMNPARSLGPALVSMTWQSHWIYWLAPFCGASLASLTYERIR